jgi:hypothetical protein
VFDFQLYRILALKHKSNISYLTRFERPALLRYIHGGDKNGLAGEDDGCLGEHRGFQGESDVAYEEHGMCRMRIIKSNFIVMNYGTISKTVPWLKLVTFIEP